MIRDPMRRIPELESVMKCDIFRNIIPNLILLLLLACSDDKPGSAFEVSGWFPNWSTIDGGQTVVIEGRGLDSVVKVRFGSHAGTIVEKTVDRLTVTTPAVPAGGLADLILESKSHTYTAPGAWRFLGRLLDYQLTTETAVVDPWPMTMRRSRPDQFGDGTFLWIAAAEGLFHVSVDPWGIGRVEPVGFGDFQELVLGDFDGDGRQDRLEVLTTGDASMLWNAGHDNGEAHPAEVLFGLWQATAFDCDGDGADDLLAAMTDPGVAKPLRVFSATPERVFTDRTAEVFGGEGLTFHGAAVADLDGDMDADLFLTTPQGPRLFINDGNCVFLEAPVSALPREENVYTTEPITVDVNLDTRPDLVIPDTT
ncbi:MAG: hypothetical protein CVU59_02880, partial [Deltaproteobacteria bacterium HGW-Deltaproteobacteria-17]